MENFIKCCFTCFTECGCIKWARDGGAICHSSPTARTDSVLTIQFTPFTRNMHDGDGNEGPSLDSNRNMRANPLHLANNDHIRASKT
ncbi:MAG: hypothetical protein PVH87_04745 [Desulfobacteraceae bacterium]|jgi:hypothetical protein